MTTVTINNQRIEPDIDSNTTLKDLKEIIFDDFSKGGRIVTSMFLDKKKYFFDNTDSDGIKIKNYNEIDFTIKSDLDVAFESVDSCHTFLDLIVKKIHAVLSDYSSNAMDSANRQFLELVENIDVFVQLITSINETLDFHFKEKYSQDKTTIQLETSLLDIIRSILEAKEKNDIVMICDVLEHQLIVNLSDWQKSGLSKFQRFREMKRDS